MKKISRKFNLYITEDSGGKEGGTEEPVTLDPHDSYVSQDTVCPRTLTPNSISHLILIHGRTTIL